MKACPSLHPFAGWPSCKCRVCAPNMQNTSVGVSTKCVYNDAASNTHCSWPPHPHTHTIHNSIVWPLGMYSCCWRAIVNQCFVYSTSHICSPWTFSEHTEQFSSIPTCFMATRKWRLLQWRVPCTPSPTVWLCIQCHHFYYLDSYPSQLCNLAPIHPLLI